MQAMAMRARWHVAALPLVAVLMGSVAMAPALADDATTVPTMPSTVLPAVVAQATAMTPDQPIAPPAPALADIRLIVSRDTTGSLPTGAWTGAARAVPPALALDDAAAPVRPMIGARVAALPDATAVPAVPDAPPPAIQANVPPAEATPVVTSPAPAASTDAPVAATEPPASVAPAAAPVVAPSTTLDAAAIAAALPDFIDKTVAGDTVAQAAERRKIREAVGAFYAAHDNAPLWVADAHLTPVARSVLARLDHAAEDGLDLHRFTVAVPRNEDVATLVRGELMLSESTIAYARQASGSRVDVAKIGGIIDMRPEVVDAERVLTTVPAAADAGETLQAFNPPQPGYAALREKLAELRARGAPEARSHIPAGPVLKLGMRDARVPLIRARFGLDVASVEPGVAPLVYDTHVVAAVAGFQRAHGLPASGLLTPSTVAALSGGNPATLEGTIVANMEIWRWLPRDTGPDRVEVNIPEFTARVFRDGAMIHQTRVVVGQPDKQTPVFAQQMKFIIVNPYWNVPLSIIKNEMMPKLAHDRNYFADHGYEVVERDGVRYVRQPPGDGNALGRIKFMFPNTHAVYLHDTNARSYFGRDMRALSHGCVRVEEPFSFAEAVLGKENGWPEARIRKLIGGQERTINLPRPLPILITYFTASVDPQAGFLLRDDVYGYVQKVQAALELQG